jgi:F0F1-type ATP synthase assembly protein I
MKLIVQEILLVSTITVICVAAALFIAQTANSVSYIGL